jgi:MarR family transcriptional regulator, organic hydroperoxide resistance regulator
MSRKNNVLPLLKPRKTARQGRRPQAKGLALDVLTQFRHVINANKRHFKWVEQQTGVNGTLVGVLCELGRSPGLRVSELAETLAIHQSTASNLLDKLQQQGLIERDRSTEDQRVVRLRLTRSGEALAKRVPQPSRGLLQEALFRLPPASLQGLSRLLEQLLQEMNPSSSKNRVAGSAS